MDFSIVYDHGYYNDSGRFIFEDDVRDDLFFYTLPKGNHEWEVFLPFSKFLGQGNESFEDIRYEFSGNNGVSGDGITIDGIKYYFKNDNGEIRN